MVWHNIVELYFPTRSHNTLFTAHKQKIRAKVIVFGRLLLFFTLDKLIVKRYNLSAPVRNVLSKQFVTSVTRKAGDKMKKFLNTILCIMEFLLEIALIPVKAIKTIYNIIKILVK